MPTSKQRCESLLADMRRKYLHARAKRGDVNWLAGEPITAQILERWIPEIEALLVSLPVETSAPLTHSPDPSAYLKLWDQNGPRCRVDLTPINEPWLEALKPIVTPLYARMPSVEPTPELYTQEALDTAHRRTRERLATLKVDAELPVGKRETTSFGQGMFDDVLAEVRAVKATEPSGPPLYRHDWETLPGGSYRCKRCKTTCLDAHDALLCAVRPEKATACNCRPLPEPPSANCPIHGDDICQACGAELVADTCDKCGAENGS